MSNDLATVPYYAQCGGKKQFDSAILANKVAKRLASSKRHRHKTPPRSLTAYRCAHCGFFHLGGGETVKAYRQTPNHVRIQHHD